jgi:uncharacterized membrane protein YbhN (UPF0104 family)
MSAVSPPHQAADPSIVERPVGNAPAARARARWRPWARAAVGVGILAALLLQVGAEPFLRGLASVSLPGAAAAMALGAAATAAAAWRWRLLSARLGLPLAWKASMSAYYRSQFINTVLPGGVVGDVDRAVSHGRSTRQIAQAARAVTAERAVGQSVQLVLAAVVLASAGISAYAPAMAILLVVVAVIGGAAVAAAAVSGRIRAALRREFDILRSALGSFGTMVRVVAASGVVVAAHVATFAVACAAVGVAASVDRVMAVAVIAVLAASIPLSIGGWGPREGAAAWAFGAAGLGSAAGVAAATAYGALVMIALAPGAAVLAASAVRRRRAAHARREPVDA